MAAPFDSPLFLAVLSVLAAALVVFGAERLRRPRRRPATGDGAVFLFEGDRLVDATPAARLLLGPAGGTAAGLRATLALLEQRFPSAGDRLRVAAPDETHEIAGLAPGEMLIAECWANHTRLAVTAVPAPRGVDALRLSVAETELQALRAIAEDAPQLIWKEDGGGAVIWANRAYLALADRVTPPERGATPGWPARPVFGDGSRPDGDGQPQTRRAALTVPGASGPRWFEVTRVRRGGQIVGFATDATGAVAAEEARRDFVQTLTKTFAHLKAGLAIFDRQRRLVLFNPAFLDLTGLRVDFLSQRPMVHSVLDRLRDMQMLPEPKNYATWREQIAALESAAEQGTYCETWVLPGGQTYRVSGRPHPDGALAFLFEDISDEISLTRHFRLEQETGQAVLDHLPQAIAVFSAGGTMTLANAAYERLWGERPGGLHDPVRTGEIDRWRARSVPAPVWDRIAGLFAQGPDRQAGQESLRLTDGRIIAARFVPLPGGATLVEFEEMQGDGLALVEQGGGEERAADPVAGAAMDLRETGTRPRARGFVGGHRKIPELSCVCGKAD